MSDPSDKAETPELTPEAKAVLSRARRSFLVSMGLLVLGLIAIGGALVYRSSQSESKASGSEYVIAALKIPDGGQVISAVAADGRVTLTYKLGAMTSVRIFDGKTGELVREIPVVSE